MSIIGTFQGVSIVALPASPGFRQVEFVANEAVTVSRSPFTGETQVQAWPGGDWWEATVTLPQMTRIQAAAWVAWQSELRGIQNVFYLGDPLATHPMGVPKGTPVASGLSNVAMSQSLVTTGWTPSIPRHLLPGDQIQIGNRLHRVLDLVNFDADGNATLSIWPSLRETVADGTPLILHSPVGLFRLADNKRSISTVETRLSAITFKAVEAQ